MMQPSSALVLVFGLLLVAPSASSHTSTGPALQHVQVKAVQLDPSANETILIETGEGPWQAGMIFVLFVSFFNESRSLGVELLFNHEASVQSWTLLDDATHKVSVRLPFDDGPYELRFTNRADRQTQLLFYFDQTCNCVAKPIPLDEGWVVFHYDLRGGRTYEIATPVPAAWKVRAALAVGGAGTGAWPTDFLLLEDVTLQGAPFWINLTVAPEDDARHFVVYEALEGSPRFPDPQQYVEVTPRIRDLTEEEGGDSPGVGLLFIVGALAGVGVRLRRRG